jgi:hypothetical protein
LINLANETVLENAMQITDQESLRIEDAMGDDVAGVRTTADPVAVHNDTSPDTNNNPSMSYSSVCYRDLESNRDRGLSSHEVGMVHVLDAAAEAIGEDVRPSVNKWVKSARTTLPINEVDSKDFRLTGAFPNIFMYGKGYHRAKMTPSGTEEIANPIQLYHSCQPKDLHKHLLFQYTNLPATQRELIFYLFDSDRRHQTNSNLAIKVRGEPDKMEKFGEMVISPEFKQKLQHAVAHP